MLCPWASAIPSPAPPVPGEAMKVLITGGMGVMGAETSRITHIVHAAGFVGAVSAANPALSIQVNVMGTVNVLEAARAFDVKRVVYTSSKGVYGPALGEYGAPTYK